MLSKEEKVRWFKLTWRWSIVWVMVLAVVYVIHYGWMSWPKEVIREQVISFYDSRTGITDVVSVPRASIDWWLIFILQAVYPAILSFFCLSLNLFKIFRYFEPTGLGFILGGIPGALIFGVAGFYVGGLPFGIISALFGFYTSLFIFCSIFNFPLISKESEPREFKTHKAIYAFFSGK